MINIEFRVPTTPKVQNPYGVVDDLMTGPPMLSVDMELPTPAAIRFNGVWYSPTDAQTVVRLNHEWDRLKKVSHG